MIKSSVNVKNIHSRILADTILFFDMDGTLIDTNLANFLSYKKAISHVVKSSPKLNYNPAERFNRSVLKNIVSSLDDIDYAKIVDTKEKYYPEFLQDTRLNVTIANILDKYSRTNKTVLVSNCREERALMTLHYHGLTEKFSHFFFRNFSPDKSKVNKFQHAINFLQISGDQVFVFEDETAEIQDAIEAGINNYFLVQS